MSNLMNFDKIWICGFILVMVVWSLVLISTIGLGGENVLVDREVDLTLLTLIPVAISVLYFFVWIVIYSLYLLAFHKVRNHQVRLVEKQRRNNSVTLSSIGLSSYVPKPELCSIIIPARNESSVIKRTILTCLQQSYKNIEVLVIAHNSTDGTYEEAEIIADDRVRAFDFKTAETGKGVALNYGVKKARGKYILVLDADGILSNDFLENAFPLLHDSDFVAVQGRFISSNRTYNFITRMLSLEDDLWSAPFMTIRSLFGRRCPLAGTGFVIRKDVLTDVGGFGTSLVDDFELAFRLFRRKKRIIYAPLSVIYDEKPPSMEIMFKQRARWAKGFISLLKQQVAEPGDVIGHLIWLNPVAALSGLAMLTIVGYASVHNLVLDYYPFMFSYLPLSIWFLTTAVFFVLQILVLGKQFGYKGLLYATYLPIYMVFSQYFLVVTLKGFFVKSWGSTKTVHGFMAKSEMEKILSQAQHVGRIGSSK
jgi:cellulose synthase/poly-beta-1,6-N-acetylglucosamine synthase-like glycosyltransferase